MRVLPNRQGEIYQSLTVSNCLNPYNSQQNGKDTYFRSRHFRSHSRSFRKKETRKKHEVIVVSPNANYQWVPSNINVDNIGLAIDIRQSFLQQYFRHRHRLRTTTYHFKTDDQ